jgi:hypothetical protein
MQKKEKIIYVFGRIRYLRQERKKKKKKKLKIKSENGYEKKTVIK